MTIEQLAGQSLDCYKIVNLLAIGETGAIFKAQDVKLQQDVAI